MKQYEENQVLGSYCSTEQAFYLSEGSIQEIELMPRCTESLLEKIAGNEGK